MSDSAPTGKRQRRWVSGKTKTEAKQKLLAMRRDQSAALPTEHRTYTVREAVESWLEHGLTGRNERTVTNRTILAQTHVIPALESRRLVDLTPEEVDAWLAAKSETPSTDTLHRLLSILRRSIRRAQARELVRRNVALLVRHRGHARQTVEVTNVASSDEVARRRRGHFDERIHRLGATDRCANRGAAGAHLGSAGLGRGPANH
jgi:hypothetical protein